MSPNAQTDKSVWTTPRAADETMCVTGEVTLMERKPAIQMRKPMTPCKCQYCLHAVEIRDAGEGVKTGMESAGQQAEG